MMLLFLIATSIIIGYTVALDCYQCTNINNTANCHNIVVCQAQEKCFTRSDGAGDATTYTLGCKQEDQCISVSTVSPVSIVGRSVTNQLVCSQCCSVDGCNKKLCSAGTQIVNEVGDCQDDPHFDCATISSVFSVCGDIARAKTVCRKFCGLCNVVDGGWSLWSSWGNCDVTCSSGHMTRMRLCTAPAPAHGGLDCIGNNTDSKSCSLKTCPTDGAWSLWSSWGSCSVTCGVGLQRRDRSCSNPFPDRNGYHCFGDARDDRTCFEKACQDGHWSTWSTWGACTATCGTGLKSRTRSCDNPPPSQFGHDCSGNNEERDLCSDKACPVNGGWSLWSSWGNCDVTCSSGHMTRMRSCTAPAQAHGGLDCIGNNTDTKSCLLKTCPINGAWSLWSSWGSCSVTCGVGLQRRDRSCSNPFPDSNGDHCFGDARDDRSCFEKACQDGHWSTWSTWGACTATCGTGLKSRTRSCNNPPPSQFGRDCSGTDEEQDLCNDRACPAHHVAFSVNTPNGVLHNGVPVFTHVTTNLGGGYTTTTGIFTCPVAGLYQFSVYILEVGSSSAWCYIQHNGADIAYSQTDTGDIDSASASTYLSLVLGDNVKLNCGNWDDVHKSYSTIFKGALLEAD